MTDDGGGDHAFEDPWKGRFAESRSAHGACPGTLSLIRFAEGDLEAGEAVPIAEHVAVCGSCDAVVFRLRRGRRGGVWKPLFAYTLAGCLGAVLATGFWVRPAARNRPAGVETATFEPVRVISLDATRGVGSESVGPFAAPFLALAFFVPTESNKRYKGTLRDSRGEAVLSQDDLQSYDGRGNFLLVLPRRALKPGEYHLRIEDSAGTRYYFEVNL